MHVWSVETVVPVWVSYATDEHVTEVGSVRDDESVAYESAHSAGVHGHAVQAKASRIERASREPPVGGVGDDDDTDDVLAPVAGRSVIVSPQAGQP